MYGVAIIAIVVILISTIGLVRLVLNEYVFDVKGWAEMEDYWECEDGTLFEKWDNEVGDNVQIDPDLTEDQKAEKKSECIEKTDAKRALQHSNDVKSDFVTWISMLIVALPLFLFHWGLIKKD